MSKLIRSVLLSMLVLLSINPLIYAATDAAIENAVLIQVNAYRISHHLKPLKMDSRISKEAKKHSSDMAKHSVPFGHQYFLNRVARLRVQIKMVTAAAENVALGYKDAQTVVKSWLNSPGHRKNIMGNYNLTGVGIARDARGRIYFTQIFLKVTAPAR